MGNVTSRTWSGSHARVQNLVWDELGRLTQVTELYGSTTNLLWNAQYDGLGRRLRSIETRFAGGVAATPSVTESWYDPSVEFLEVAVSYQGQRWWKLHGPDLNGSYGGSQGIGGLEGAIRESDGLTEGLLSDYFGNGLATVSGTIVTWGTTPLAGYGPVLGYDAPKLGSNVSPMKAVTWRGRRIDPTGFYHFGVRYQDPVEGRWLSPDPLGHIASMSLYDYCGNDPINGVDPEGRITKNALDADASANDPYTHAMHAGLARGLIDFGLPLEKMNASMGAQYVFGPLASFAQPFVSQFFDSFSSGIDQGYGDHTSGFNTAQGYIYSSAALAGEVGPNAIPVAGAEEATAGMFAKAGSWLSKNASAFTQDVVHELVPKVMGWLESFVKPAAEGGASRLRLNIFGEGEAPGFVDVSSNARFANGRPLMSEFANGSASDIFIRSAPVTGGNTISEIVRLSQPGTRITLMQPASGFQGQALIDAFGENASVNFMRTFPSQTVAPGVDMTILRMTVGSH